MIRTIKVHKGTVNGKVVAMDTDLQEVRSKLFARMDTLQEALTGCGVNVVMRPLDRARNCVESDVYDIVTNPFTCHFVAEIDSE